MLDRDQVRLGRRIRQVGIPRVHVEARDVDVVRCVRVGDVELAGDAVVLVEQRQRIPCSKSGDPMSPLRFTNGVASSEPFFTIRIAPVFTTMKSRESFGGDVRNTGVPSPLATGSSRSESDPGGGGFGVTGFFLSLLQASIDTMTAATNIRIANFALRISTSISGASRRARH
jgi:hypothetical protein